MPYHDSLTHLTVRPGQASAFLIPMPPAFETAITVIALVFVVLYLIRVPDIADVPVPKLRGG